MLAAKILIRLRECLFTTLRFIYRWNCIRIWDEGWKPVFVKPDLSPSLNGFTIDRPKVVFLLQAIVHPFFASFLWFRQGAISCSNLHCKVRNLRKYVPSEDTDLPATSRNLIRIFIGLNLDSLGCNVSSRKLLLVCAEAQADSSLHWAHMPVRTLSHFAAHFMYLNTIFPSLGRNVFHKWLFLWMTIINLCMILQIQDTYQSLIPYNICLEPVRFWTGCLILWLQNPRTEKLFHYQGLYM